MYNIYIYILCMCIIYINYSCIISGPSAGSPARAGMWPAHSAEFGLKEVSALSERVGLRGNWNAGFLG